ncbi:hypothetical protein TNCT_607491, partial [Trichonephila clavata]
MDVSKKHHVSKLLRCLVCAYYTDICRSSRQGSLERIIDSSPLTKAERKKLEKYNKFNIDLQ